jgi:hypothetical protein
MYVMSTYMHAYINILAYIYALLTSTHAYACMYVYYTLVKWVGDWLLTLPQGAHMCIHAALHAYWVYFTYVHTYVGMHVWRPYICEVGRWLVLWHLPHEYLHTRVGTYTYMPTHTLHAQIMHVHMLTYSCMHTCVHAYICVHTVLCMHTYIHACSRFTYCPMHTCIHTYMHAYIHTYMHTCI